MTEAEAQKIADDMLCQILRSGNAEIFNAAKDANGRVDQHKLAMAAMNVRKTLAEKIMKGEI